MRVAPFGLSVAAGAGHNHPMSQSSRMARVQAPVIPMVGALVNDHPGTISLGQGMVSYGPPPEALDAMRTFADDHAAASVRRGRR